MKSFRLVTLTSRQRYSRTSNFLVRIIGLTLFSNIDDYINTVGHNDVLVKKLKNEIDTLRSQLNEKEEVIK
jgi:hypothetical protein